jgi:hypothetical protein
LASSVPPAALMKLATLATSVSVSTAVRVIQQMVSSGGDLFVPQMQMAH